MSTVEENLHQQSRGEVTVHTKGNYYTEMKCYYLFTKGEVTKFIGLHMRVSDTNETPSSYSLTYLRQQVHTGYQSSKIATWYSI